MAAPKNMFADLIPQAQADGGMSQEERINLQASGAPILRADRDPFRFIKDPVARDKARASSMNNASKSQIKAQPDIDKLDKQIADADDFATRNERLRPDGSLLNRAKNWLTNWGGDSDLTRMNQLQANAARQQRQAGEGATSDYEGKLYFSMVGGADKPYGANVGFANGQKVWGQVQKSKFAFRDAFVATNGTLLGADQMWNQYRRENPIFVAGKVDKWGNPVVNRNVRNWNDWLATKANNYMATRNRPKAAPAAARPAAPRSGGNPVYDINGNRIR